MQEEEEDKGIGRGGGGGEHSEWDIREEKAEYWRKKQIGGGEK